MKFYKEFEEIKSKKVKDFLKKWNKASLNTHQTIIDLENTKTTHRSSGYVLVTVNAFYYLKRNHKI